ncbi:MAG TPA: hypothetical protein VG013_06205, partial [Gemmataceae bacterium]|nr:hypothetical protein [Gemmataceae bacterium]
MLLKRLQRWSNWNSATAKRRRRTVTRSAQSSFRAQLEVLEDRTMPAVTFTPQLAYTIPTTNPDTARGNANFGTVIEPNVAIDPNNAANVAVSSQAGIMVTTNGGATYSASVPFVSPPGQTVNSGDTWAAFDSQGRLFWTNLVGKTAVIPGVAVEQVNPATGTVVANTAVQVDAPAGAANDDKQFLAADSNPNSPFANNLYLVWTQFNHAYASG